MTLVWNDTEGDNGTLLSFAECGELASAAIYEALGQATERAVSFIADNMSDEARYFMFEWDAASGVLTIVVSDDDKQVDAPKVVKLSLAGVAKLLRGDAVSDWPAEPGECFDNIKYFLRDYLTTSTAYHKFSLIAVIHTGSRTDTDLV